MQSSSHPVSQQKKVIWVTTEVIANTGGDYHAANKLCRDLREYYRSLYGEPEQVEVVFIVAKIDASRVPDSHDAHKRIVVEKNKNGLPPDVLSRTPDIIVRCAKYDAYYQSLYYQLFNVESSQTIAPIVINLTEYDADINFNGIYQDIGTTLKLGLAPGQLGVRVTNEANVENYVSLQHRLTDRLKAWIPPSNTHDVVSGYIADIHESLNSAGLLEYIDLCLGLRKDPQRPMKLICPLRAEQLVPIRMLLQVRGYRLGKFVVKNSDGKLVDLNEGSNEGDDSVMSPIIDCINLFPLEHNDMLLLQRMTALSGSLHLSTGDQSFVEGALTNAIEYYQIVPHKLNHFKSFVDYTVTIVGVDSPLVQFYLAIMPNQPFDREKLLAVLKNPQTVIDAKKVWDSIRCNRNLLDHLPIFVNLIMDVGRMQRGLLDEGEINHLIMRVKDLKSHPEYLYAFFHVYAENIIKTSPAFLEDAFLRKVLGDRELASGIDAVVKRWGSPNDLSVLSENRPVVFHNDANMLVLARHAEIYGVYYTSIWQSMHQLDSTLKVKPFSDFKLKTRAIDRCLEVDKKKALCLSLFDSINKYSQLITLLHRLPIDVRAAELCGGRGNVDAILRDNKPSEKNGIEILLLVSPEKRGEVLEYWLSKMTFSQFEQSGYILLRSLFCFLPEQRMLLLNKYKAQWAFCDMDIGNLMRLVPEDCRIQFLLQNQDKILSLNCDDKAGVLNYILSLPSGQADTLLQHLPVSFEQVIDAASDQKSKQRIFVELALDRLEVETVAMVMSGNKHLQRLYFTHYMDNFLKSSLKGIMVMLFLIDDNVLKEFFPEKVFTSNPNKDELIYFLSILKHFKENKHFANFSDFLLISIVSPTFMLASYVRYVDGPIDFDKVLKLTIGRSFFTKNSNNRYKLIVDLFRKIENVDDLFKLLEFAEPINHYRFFLLAAPWFKQYYPKGIPEAELVRFQKIIHPCLHDMLPAACRPEDAPAATPRGSF